MKYILNKNIDILGLWVWLMNKLSHFCNMSENRYYYLTVKKKIYD